MPSVSDLSLVELYSGESALISYTTSADLRSNTATISYFVDDTYSERFGYWSGHLKTDVVDIVEGRNCAL
mgnify:CR=1 FL=1